MPIQSIMNAPMSFGPSLSDQQEAKDMRRAQVASGVAGSMAGTEMQRMKNESFRKRGDVLSSFEGRTDTPEFNSAMMSADPGLAMKMQEGRSSQRKDYRERMNKHFESIAAKAEMDNTEDKWKARGWARPFSDRRRIISEGMSKLRQATDYNKGEYDKTQAALGPEGSDWTMKAADSNSIKSSINSLYKGVYGPDGGFNFSDKEIGLRASKITKRASAIYRRGRGQVSHNEAAYQAMEEVYGEPKKSAGKSGIKMSDPLGIR